LWRPADHEALLSVLRWIKFDLRCFQHVPCTIPNYKTTMIWDITHVYIYIIHMCTHYENGGWNRPSTWNCKVIFEQSKQTGILPHRLHSQGHEPVQIWMIWNAVLSKGF
jgi:hypothetical protein